MTKQSLFFLQLYFLFMHLHKILKGKLLTQMSIKVKCKMYQTYNSQQ